MRSCKKKKKKNSTLRPAGRNIWMPRVKHLDSLDKMGQVKRWFFLSPSSWLRSTVVTSSPLDLHRPRRIDEDRKKEKKRREMSVDEKLSCVNEMKESQEGGKREEGKKKRNKIIPQRIITDHHSLLYRYFHVGVSCKRLMDGKRRKTPSNIYFFFSV